MQPPPSSAHQRESTTALAGAKPQRLEPNPPVQRHRKAAVAAPPLGRGRCCSPQPPANAAALTSDDPKPGPEPVKPHCYGDCSRTNARLRSKVQARFYHRSLRGLGQYRDQLRGHRAQRADNNRGRQFKTSPFLRQFQPRSGSRNRCLSGHSRWPKGQQTIC